MLHPAHNELHVCFKGRTKAFGVLHDVSNRVCLGSARASMGGRECLGSARAPLRHIPLGSARVRLRRDCDL